MVLPCRITWRQDRHLWVENLEKLTRALSPPKAVLARFQLGAGGFRIEPLTAYFEKGAPQHLTYKPLDVPARAAPQVVPVPVPVPVPKEVKP